MADSSPDTTVYKWIVGRHLELPNQMDPDQPGRVVVVLQRSFHITRGNIYYVRRIYTRIVFWVNEDELKEIVYGHPETEKPRPDRQHQQRASLEQVRVKPPRGKPVARQSRKREAG